MRIRLIILLALAVFLVWEVVTKGGAAYLADASPETATALRASEPTALLNLAEKKLRDLDTKKTEPVAKPNEANPDARPEEIQDQQSLDSPRQQDTLAKPDDASRIQTRSEIRSLAERALLSDPLNAHALRILGQLSVQSRDDKQAETFMHAAVRRSLFESDAVYWMMHSSYKAKNYQAAIVYAITLLKTRQNVSEFVMPILGNVAENHDSTGHFRKLLASNPSWREGFFSSLSGNISDARTPLEIFLSLKETKAPPTLSELRYYLNFLIDRKFYDLAYYTWLQFLPPEQLTKVGNLNNGSFEVTPSQLPFDWVWTEKPGATVKISMRPDQEGEHALQIAFGPGRVDFSGITQLIILPPGSYQFQGRYKANIVSPRGLHWRITCAGIQGAPIGESTTINEQDSSWQDFQLSFSIPKTDCPAQFVTLVSGARSPSEQFISGTISYDNLKIVNESVVTPSKEPL